MITIGDAKKVISCAQFVPLIAVIDADLSVNLPASVIAGDGQDTIAHAVESLLSTSRSVFTAMSATAALEILVRSSRRPEGDQEARGRVLYAARSSGLALNAGVVLGHSLAYVIARRAPIPHGPSCALALPYCLAYNGAIPVDLAAHMARLLTAGESDDLQTAAASVQALSDRLGLPQSLDELGIPRSVVDEMSSELLRDYPRRPTRVPLTTTGRNSASRYAPRLIPILLAELEARYRN